MGEYEASADWLDRGFIEREADKKRIRNILEPYKGLNFVDRILNRDQYPTLEYGDGNHATHRMSYGNEGDDWYAYPEVVYDPSNDELQELGRREAWDHAQRTKERIPFRDMNTADWFTKNYKKIWD